MTYVRDYAAELFEEAHTYSGTDIQDALREAADLACEQYSTRAEHVVLQIHAAHLLGSSDTSLKYAGHIIATILDN